MSDIKVEKALWSQTVSDIGAIRCYCKHRKFAIDCTVESGEHPRLKIKRTNRKKTGEPEVEIVFLGEHHDETHTYYKKDPKYWTSFGFIAVTPAKAREIASVINEAGSPTLLDFKPRIISLADLKPTLSVQSSMRKHRHGRTRTRKS